MHLKSCIQINMELKNRFLERTVYEKDETYGSVDADKTVLTEEMLPNVSGVFEGIAQGTVDTTKPKSVLSAASKGQLENEFLSAASAFAKFKDKEFRSSDDANSMTARQPSREQYSLDVDLVGRTKCTLETPSQRISRLKMEVAEMIEFIQSTVNNAAQGNTQQKTDIVGSTQELKTASHDKTSSAMAFPSDVDADRDVLTLFGMDPESLVRELEVLRDQIDRIEVASYMSSTQNAKSDTAPLVDATETAALGLINPSLVSEGKHCKGVLSPSCLQAISSHLSTVQARVQGPQASVRGHENASQANQQCNGDTPQFAYEVYTASTYGQLLELSRVLELERRLADLETTLGIEKSSHLSLPFPDISSALTEIVSRLALLHPGRVEKLIKRFQDLSTHVDDLFSRKERMSMMQQVPPGTSRTSNTGSGGNDNNEAVQELYQFCESTRTVVAGLPVVVKRLKTLKALHQDAAGLNQRLTDLESRHAEVHQALTAMELEMGALRTSLSTTVDWAKDIVSAVQNGSVKQMSPAS